VFTGAGLSTTVRSVRTVQAATRPQIAIVARMTLFMVKVPPLVSRVNGPMGARLPFFRRPGLPIVNYQVKYHLLKGELT
jgi:hypothetical protein